MTRPKTRKDWTLFWILVAFVLGAIVLGTQGCTSRAGNNIDLPPDFDVCAEPGVEDCCPSCGESYDSGFQAGLETGRAECQRARDDLAGCVFLLFEECVPQLSECQARVCGEDDDDSDSDSDEELPPYCRWRQGKP